MDLAIPAPQLMGFALALIRTTAWISICPPFNSPAIPKRIRVGLATAISLLLATKVSESVDVNASTGEFLLLAFTQVGAGLALGFIVFMLFGVIQAAGELIDLQVGFALGAVLDPLSGTSAAPIGRFHQLLAVTILFAIDGHTLVIRGYMRSVEAVPLGEFSFSELVQEMIGLFTAFSIAAVEIGLPVLAALFVAEISLGLLGKAAPQMNILVIGFAAKTFIAFGLLSITVVALPNTVESILVRSFQSISNVFGG
ncbi:MAG: flagellar biosynthetic protein FliR [Ilumatobacter sp.]